MANALVMKTKLDPKLREIAILRTAKVSRSVYEWTQHVPMARHVGVTDVPYLWRLGWAAGGGVENSTAEVYEPATASFGPTGGMEIGRSGHAATLLPNGSVLVAGGGIFPGLVSAELYQ